MSNLRVCESLRGKPRHLVGGDLILADELIVATLLLDEIVVERSEILLVSTPWASSSKNRSC